MSTYQLKRIALLCMLLDHLAEYVPNVPSEFRLIGRFAAPIFFFCSAWAMDYTRNLRIYLLRLYVLGVVMALGNNVMFHIMGAKEYVSNNIFTTLFIGGVIVYILNTKVCARQKAKYLLIFIGYQVAALFLCSLFAEIINFPHGMDTYMLYYLYGSIFGSIVLCEGGVSFVIFFVALYYVKKNKFGLQICMLFFSTAVWLIGRRFEYARGFLSYLFPFSTIQWVMLLAIPIICAYNGKKGVGQKWFYYAFYPVHIWMIYIIGTLIR